jgi:hypothetical protein
MSPTLWAILIGSLTGFISFGWFFNDWKDFMVALKYTLRPNIFSWLAGELQEDYGNSMCFKVWLALVLFAAWLAFQLSTLWGS